MKKIKLLLLILVINIMIGLCGCTTKIMYINRDSFNSMKASYSTLNGTEKKGPIKFEKDDKVTFKYNSEVKKGTLTMALVNSKGNEITQFESNKQGEKEITISEEGKFYIVIKAEKTGGNYNIQWNKKTK